MSQSYGSEDGEQDQGDGEESVVENAHGCTSGAVNASTTISTTAAKSGR
jgi:hypothetical protein